MNKVGLRKEIIAELKAVPQYEKERIEARLYTYLMSTKQWNEAKTIGITISRDFEWDTSLIIQSSLAAGKRVCAPKCEPKTRGMEFYSFTSKEELEVVYYGLLEPQDNEENHVPKEEIDLLIVPGVVFSNAGYRIGFGGGYYDRYLTDYKNETLSLVSDIQLVDEVPFESFDIPVQALITEKGLRNTDTSNQ